LTDGPRRNKWLFTFLLVGLTSLFIALLFPPFYCFFLAPFALVPLSTCVLRRPMTWRYLGVYYLGGVAFFVPNLFWLGPVTVPGYILLGLYLAIYFPLFAFALHRLVNGLRLPAILALPLAWTAIEYIRATCLEGGFPWFLLGNSFAPATPLVQIADLFGVWGVTFFICLLNGALVDVLRLPLRKNNRLNPMIGRIIAVAFVMCLFVIGYGVYRVDQKTTTPGPRVAVIQENIPQSIKQDPREKASNFKRYLDLARAAAYAEPTPDLVAWPETMIYEPLNPEWLNVRTNILSQQGLEYLRESQKTDAIIRDLSNSTGVAMLVGVPGFDLLGDGKQEQQNITMLYLPGEGPSLSTYAKVHLVPFGEYIPFLNLPLVGKYMINIAPEGTDYSLTPGTRFTRFTFSTHSMAFVKSAATNPSSTSTSRPAFSEITSTTRVYRFATPICFEDTMPEPARRMTAPQFDNGRKADFLINVSNDGWFYSVELDQRLQASQLRAVENRVPIARSVNTGDSGFVDSCGRVVKLVTDANGRSIGAVGTASLVMEIDSRVTLFSQVGDILPILCGIAAILGVGWTVVRPRRGPKQAA
jgi:apolipoprotein N-acyltransferase